MISGYYEKRGKGRNREFCVRMNSNIYYPEKQMHAKKQVVAEGIPKNGKE